MTKKDERKRVMEEFKKYQHGFWGKLLVEAFHHKKYDPSDVYNIVEQYWKEIEKHCDYFVKNTPPWTME